MSNIRGIPGEIPVDGNIYKGIETESTTTHVNNFTKEISVNVKEDYLNEKLKGKQDKLIAGEGIEINENNEISAKRAEDTLEITSEDITIEDGKIVFNSDVAQEIMSMNKRIKVDASIVTTTLQFTYIGLFTPRAIMEYPSISTYTIYEYSTTNCLMDEYRTTYIEFVWDKTTEKLYVDADNPTFEENHITGFRSDNTDGNINLTYDVEMHTPILNVLHINDFNIISTDSNQPSLKFNANSSNELESIVFKQDGYSSYSNFNYTIPKGAKHYVVNELPTTDIDTTGNYYVMTESEDARGYLSTDIHNLTTTEYPSPNTGALRQNATVNSSDWVKLNATTVSSGDYMGDIAIKFNIPCEVTLSVNPRQTRLAFMYIDVNGVNVKLVNAGETYTYTRVFSVDETLCVRGASFSTNQFYYKLAIQPYTIDGKIPLSTNVDEYINFENLWFKNGGSSVSLYQHNIHFNSSWTDNRRFLCTIISNSATPFNVTSFIEFLSNGFDYNTKLYPVSSNNICGIFNNNGAISGVGQTNQENFGPVSYYTLTDVVMKIL